MARFFVNRPIVAMVLSIIIVLVGLVAMRGLPIAQYPEIVPPMIQVTTTFIGAPFAMSWLTDTASAYPICEFPLATSCAVFAEPLPCTTVTSRPASL